MAGGNDDFFALGGDSLAAMVLLTALSQMGHEVPLTLLIRHRTPAALAEALARGEGAEGPVGVSPWFPAFVVPGVGGDEPVFAEFRAACAGQAPFALVDYPDWASAMEPGYGMPMIARDVAERIGTSVPAGPLVLAGYSTGGLVALAASTLLIRAGRQVLGVMLFDTARHGRTRPTGRLARMREVGYAAADIVDALLAGVLAQKLVSQAGRWLARGSTTYLLGVAKHLRGLSLPARMRYALHRAVSSELQGKAMRPWRETGFVDPGLPKDTPVVLFRAAGCDTSADAVAWRADIPGLRVIDVTGDHIGMLRERGTGSLAHRVGPVFGDMGGTDAIQAQHFTQRPNRV